MNKPLLSVCLITYNHANYIKEAIDTILMQKVDFAWELIIADDFSTDGTREILLEYEKKHPDLIKLILQKSNVGPEKNWLDLMAYPRSKYVLYAEGDDYFSDSNKLQKQVNFLEAHNDFSICFHPVKVIYEDKSRPDEIYPTPELYSNKDTLELNDLLTYNFIQTNSAMYRWRFIEENIKDIFPKNIAPGDWFLHILHAQIGKIGFIDQVMSVYRRHPGGMWWSPYKNSGEMWKKYGLAQLRFYNEMLKLFGDKIERRKIIDEHISNMFSNLMKVDDKHKEKLVEKAILEFPEAAEIFIAYQDKELNRRDKKLHEREARITALEQESQHKDQQLKQKDKEIKDIKSSKFWKLRNLIAGLVGKSRL